MWLLETWIVYVAHIISQRESTNLQFLTVLRKEFKLLSSIQGDLVPQVSSQTLLVPHYSPTAVALWSLRHIKPMPTLRSFHAWHRPSGMLFSWCSTHCHADSNSLFLFHLSHHLSQAFLDQLISRGHTVSDSLLVSCKALADALSYLIQWSVPLLHVSLPPGEQQLCEGRTLSGLTQPVLDLQLRATPVIVVSSVLVECMNEQGKEHETQSQKFHLGQTQWCGGWHHHLASIADS